MSIHSDKMENDNVIMYDDYILKIKKLLFSLVYSSLNWDSLLATHKKVLLRKYPEIRQLLHIHICVQYVFIIMDAIQRASKLCTNPLRCQWMRL